MLRILIFSVFVTVGIAFDFDPAGHKNWNLLPHETCGEVTSSRIIGGVEAPMNGYPWIARIGYSKPSSEDYAFRCGGVLANSQTVLTAAHCVADLPKGSKVAVVRLGEHNLDTNPDCADDFCADPVLDVKPLEVIIPKNYNDPPYKNDIALIRTQEKIESSAFVRPICFPSGPLLQKDNIGSIAEVAGWGIYDLSNLRNSATLQVVKVPVVSNEKCQAFLPNQIRLGPTQICAGGTIGKDSCGGDSGGPLMKVDDGNNGPQYYLLGVVSFGSKQCGKTKMPGVYTKMSEYMKWFLDNLIETQEDSKVIFP